MCNKSSFFSKYVYRFLPLIFFLLLGWGFWLSLSSTSNNKVAPSALINQLVPNINLKDLITNKPISNSNLLGKSWLVNVWATWCPSCHVEHPYLVQLSNSGINIAGINYKDNKEQAIAFIANRGNPFALIFSDPYGEFAVNLGVTGAPETYFIDKKGVVRYRHIGIINPENWKNKLQNIYNKL